jgi:hypothetical protein
MLVEDGRGTGYTLRVDKNNRLHSQSVSESEQLHSAEKGDAYNVNTGLISFSANGTLLYIKNDEEKDMVIEAVAIGTFDGITYSDRPYITMVRNPTGGDLISDKSAVSMNQNRNFGSNKALGSTTLAYKGKSGGTLTGGDDIAILESSKGGRDFYTINFILQKGSSMGLKITNNISSGSANIYAAAIVYLKDPEGSD